MADLSEMLSVLDEAIEHAPRGRRSVALILRQSPVLGTRGAWLSTDDQGPMYGYTRRDCEAIRDVILDAARHDAGLG